MKRQKSAKFAKKILKINLFKIKDIVKLEITAIIQVNFEVMKIDESFKKRFANT